MLEFHRVNQLCTIRPDTSSDRTVTAANQGNSGLLFCDYLPETLTKISLSPHQIREFGGNYSIGTASRKPLVRLALPMSVTPIKGCKLGDSISKGPKLFSTPISAKMSSV